ncbi:hypothetical protein CLV63_101233 [Murinocardiopsis flavida]|uniref:YCII-related domain-containing protein n=1 Tax=Murinocardiopsis flavida TaxID=645275 RepID=A0A2P8DU58_9ACTN|nr:YciI family protein [Murinocardiopsis flavida]PSL00757.1 hypothetical protein CLV63_101233 [Murinocardiopsis flavida]
MPFYVHAEDRPGVGAELEGLAEAHWSYMDGFADRLILRGPTVSADGTEHTGSVHVVDLADRADADRFAVEEPFWSAGLYRDITTVRAVVLLDRKPAEDPRASVPNALVTCQWAPELRDAGGTEPHLLGAEPDDRVGFVAVLTNEDQSHTTGIVAVVRAHQDEAAKLVQPIADRLAGTTAPLTAQRWERGGRS